MLHPMIQNPRSSPLERQLRRNLKTSDSQRRLVQEEHLHQEQEVTITNLSLMLLRPLLSHMLLFLASIQRLSSVFYHPIITERTVDLKHRREWHRRVIRWPHPWHSRCPLHEPLRRLSLLLFISLCMQNLLQ